MSFVRYIVVEMLEGGLQAEDFGGNERGARDYVNEGTNKMKLVVLRSESEIVASIEDHT